MSYIQPNPNWVKYNKITRARRVCIGKTVEGLTFQARGNIYRHSLAPCAQCGSRYIYLHQAI